MLRSFPYTHVTTISNIFLQGTPQLNYTFYEEPSGFAQFEPAGVIWYLFVLGLEEKENNQSLFTLCSLWFYRHMAYSLSVITFPSMEIAPCFLSSTWLFSECFSAVFPLRWGPGLHVAFNRQSKCTHTKSVQVHDGVLAFPSLIFANTGLAQGSCVFKTFWDA